ncbi:MAG: hypothetical protein S4CHLAM45_01190 [Chlamydiales bacterium]|nr:hypothetical protein [Chlamydiales bacterium]MCH9619439.1 hypothetical protein [Chlamydiales bacterium]MCH9622243.1 hypothetical protein [Chlamydiales bacterium]
MTLEIKTSHWFFEGGATYDQFPKVWECIFGHLTGEALITAVLVCKVWRDYIGQTPILCQRCFLHRASRYIEIDQWPKRLVNLLPYGGKWRLSKEWEKYIETMSTCSVDKRILLAKWQFRLGDVKCGSQTLDKLREPIEGNPAKQDKRLQVIADFLIEYGAFEKALKIARQILNLGIKMKFLGKVAEGKAGKGDISGSKKIVSDEIEDTVESPYKSNSLVKIAEKQACAGKHVEALETIREVALAIKDPFYKKMVSIAIDRESIANAIKWASKIIDHEMRARAFKSVAVAQAKKGDFKNALSIAKTRCEESALQQISRVEAEAKRMENALKAADSIQDPEIKSKALQFIIKTESKRKRVLEALAIAEKVEDEVAQDHFFVTVVKTCSECGNIEGAKQALEKITNFFEKGEALVSIIEAQAKKGEFEAAIQAITDIGGVDFLEEKAFHSISLALVEKGDNRRAEEFAEQITGLYSDRKYSGLLKKLVKARASAGDFKEAVEYIKKVTSPDKKRRLLKAIGMTQAQFCKEKVGSIRQTCAASKDQTLFAEIRAGDILERALDKVKRVKRTR